MKKITLFLIVISFTLVADAQGIFESYMKRIPALPRDTCNISKAVSESWEQQVSSLRNELDKDIEDRNRDLNSYMEKNKETMQNNSIRQMQQQTGVSNEDVSKMKNAKNMTKEEKQAMANQMMMQQTNISMAEMQNLSKMSEAGKKAWAEGYATEAQANAQANPKQQTMNPNVGNMMTLQMEQQNLLNKIKIEGDRIAGLYAEVNNDPSGKAMLDKIAKWAGEKYKGTIVTDPRQIVKDDSLDVLIRKERILYCEKLTPKYRAVLRRHLASVKAFESDNRRVAEITSEINKIQTGVATPPESHDIPAMGALLDYLGKLRDAYKFNLYYPGDL
jgi:hypothetical protein